MLHCVVTQFVLEPLWTPDAAWSALTDSVKRDLADLPSLSGRPLETRITQHVQQMRRLLDMHQHMISATGQ
jgi:hypothetical protein